MNAEQIVLRVKGNIFGEFNEATHLKTSLAKYSIEFNDLAVQMRPHRVAYLRLLGRPYTFQYVKRSAGRLEIGGNFTENQNPGLVYEKEENIEI